MKTVIIEDKQRIESIILHCDACFVGITDLEGNPYVVPMNFGYENGIIYLHSGPEGSKLEMLEHNNNVCITFSVGHKLVYQHEKVACSYSMRSESAMCRGQVEFIEEIDEKRRALDIIMRHYTAVSYTHLTRRYNLQNKSGWQRIYVIYRNRILIYLQQRPNIMSVSYTHLNEKYRLV